MSPDRRSGFSEKRKGRGSPTEFNPRHVVVGGHRGMEVHGFPKLPLLELPGTPRSWSLYLVDFFFFFELNDSVSSRRTGVVRKESCW